MSYTPTNWQSGDKVTAEKLNKIEQGIVNAGGVKSIVTTLDYDAYTLTNADQLADALDEIEQDSGKVFSYGVVLITQFEEGGGTVVS